MDEMKIKHFKRDYQNLDFPLFFPLGTEQMQQIRRNLCEKTGISKSSGNLELLKSVYSRASKIEFNALDEGFELKKVFQSIDLEQEEYVYINWYRFDNIDQMRFDDLNKYFDDVWYPSSDDISIFDSKFSWILFISHSGDVYLVRFSGPDEKIKWGSVKRTVGRF